MRYDDLPGAELVLPGIEDLRRGVESVPALLVAIGRPRLSRLDLDLPPHTFDEPEHRPSTATPRTRATTRSSAAW